MMWDILIIEIESDSDIIQDIIEFIKEKNEYRITKINYAQRILSFPNLTIDLDQRIVSSNNSKINMSNNEFATLVFLANQPGRVFSKEQIYYAVYNDEEAINVDNVVYCLIRNLRGKLKTAALCHKYIQTVRGVGYKFIIPDE